MKRPPQSNIFALFFAAVVCAAWPAVAADETDEPICTIAAISNPYITALEADELGNRDWLAKTGPAGLSAAIDAVRTLEPDACLSSWDR